MREIWLSTLRTRGLRPVPLVAALAVFALSIVFAWADRGIAALPVLCALYAMLAASGIVGQDVVEGTVQLVLARPLTRGQYLLGRLLGVLTLAVLFVATSLAAGVAVARPNAASVVSVGAAALTGAVWTVALIFFFSTLLPGRADTIAAFALFLAAGTLRSVRAGIKSDWAAGLIEALWDNVCCVVTTGGAALTPAALTDLVRWASNVLVVVLAAVLVFNRRQFGYAD
jgi:hypothetical protein